MLIFTSRNRSEADPNFKKSQNYTFENRILRSFTWENLGDTPEGYHLRTEISGHDFGRVSFSNPNFIVNIRKGIT